MNLEVATCSYSEFRPEMGYPIRTSRGAPKWFTHPYMSWENAFPTYAMLKLPFEQYQPRYLQLLEKHGPEKLLGDLQFMSEEYARVNGGEVRPLVLLCYEKLSKGPDTWCHRTQLADWLTRRCGLHIEELGAQLCPPPEPEPTLW